MQRWLWVIRPLLRYGPGVAVASGIETCGPNPYSRLSVCMLGPWKAGWRLHTFQPMCGIVGIYGKSSALHADLGAHLSRMLVEMGGRGPDSAGVAIYRSPVAPGTSKLSLHAPTPGVDWAALGAELASSLGLIAWWPIGARHAVFHIDDEPDAGQDWVQRHHPSIDVMSTGRLIEIYKEAERPDAFVAEYGIDAMDGSHAIGHTRMATESRITTMGSHPFSTGPDLCLVHNGSLSNHNRLRERLRREGLTFRTENDSEVAAAYLTWRMNEGATLEQALAGCLDDLDGFYTFAVGTADGFAVLRDPIACKPAVMAETDDWVAIASEYRALDVLPGAADAEVWEPSPGVVYSWGGVTA
jgi:glutamate synthase domain-containing protein 1